MDLGAIIPDVKKWERRNIGSPHGILSEHDQN